MKLFLKKHWKDLLQLAGFLGAAALLTWVAGLLGLIMAFGIMLALCVIISSGKKTFSVGSTWGEWVTAFLLLITIYPASVSIYSWSRSMNLKFPETKSAVLPHAEKTATKKDAPDNAEANKHGIGQLQKNLVEIQRSIESKMDANFDEGQERNEIRHANLLGKLDAQMDFLKGESSKIGGSAAPPPPEENLPPPLTPPQTFPAPEEEPVLPKPKAEEIPSSEPKRQLPDLWAQVYKKLQPNLYDEEAEAEKWPTHILGSCGRAHAIVDWVDKDGNGKPEPIYGPCRNLAGNPACSFIRFGVMKWK